MSGEPDRPGLYWAELQGWDGWNLVEWNPPCAPLLFRSDSATVFPVVVTLWGPRIPAPGEEPEEPPAEITAPRMMASPFVPSPRTRELVPFALVRILVRALKDMATHAVEIQGGRPVVVWVHRDVQEGEVLAIEFERPRVD